MIWWSAVLSLFGLWILSLAANLTFGGMVHGLLIAGIAVTLLRSWPIGPGTEIVFSPRRRGKRRPSIAGTPRAGRP